MNPKASQLGVVKVECQSLYENVDYITQMWLNQLKDLWAACKKANPTRNLLHQFFTAAINPYETALQAMLNSGDFYSGKQNSLSYFFMEYFSTWLETMPNIQTHLLYDKIKADAFRIVLLQKNQSLINLVCKNYKMTESKMIFIKPIRELVARSKFKEACQCAVMLDLYDFGIEEFVIPLLFQNKYNVAEKFFEKNKQHQINLVTFLDNLLGKRNLKGEVNSIFREIDLKGIDTSRLCGKSLSKLIHRIANKFKLPETTCPNLIKRKARGALHFLLKKRFVDKNIGIESWNEIIYEAFKNDRELQKELVESVLINTSADEALMWTKKFQLPLENWPYSLRKHTEHTFIPRNDQNLNEENWDDKESIEKVSQETHEKSEFNHLNERKDEFLKELLSEENYNDLEENEAFRGIGSSSESSNSEDKVLKERKNEEWEKIGIQIVKNKNRSPCLRFDESSETGKIRISRLEESEEENWEDAEECLSKYECNKNSKYHRLSIDRSRIHFIKDVVTFFEYLKNLEKAEILGIDAEWMPIWGFRKPRLAILQVATLTDVYLISIREVGTMSGVWDYFFFNVLYNTDILKLGFGIEGDLKFLQETLFDASHGELIYDVPDGKSSVLDLQVIWKVLVEKYNFRFPFPRPETSSSRSWSLSTLVSLCFGKELDKSEQFSNWENTPLRFSQQIYAALDAYVLLEIIDVIKTEGIKQNIPFDDVLKECLKGMANNAGSEPEKPPDDGHIRPPEKPSMIHYRFFVSNSLKNLDKEMRNLGLDATICEQNPIPKLQFHASDSSKNVFVTTKNHYIRAASKFAKTYNINLDNEHFDKINPIDLINKLAQEMEVDMPYEKTPSSSLNGNCD